jgi:hypothetical protein
MGLLHYQCNRGCGIFRLIVGYYIEIRIRQIRIQIIKSKPSLIALPPHELIWYCAIYAVSSLHELNPYEFLTDPFVKSFLHKWNIYEVSFPHGQIRYEFSEYL